MNETHTCSLGHLRSGQTATVIQLQGGRAFQNRVMSMGLAIGKEVEVIRSHAAGTTSGPVVVRCGDTRLMLGHGLSEKILVRRPG